MSSIVLIKVAVYIQHTHTLIFQVEFTILLRKKGCLYPSAYTNVKLIIKYYLARKNLLKVIHSEHLKVLFNRLEYDFTRRNKTK